MNILLINDNPVVSRLLVLCTRGEHIGLDEVKRVDDVKDTGYDILFVDDASYVDNLDALLKDRRIRKKVFISYDGENVKGFDETIKKPFLPSQIMKVIESINRDEIREVADEENIVVKEMLVDIFPLSGEDEAPEESVESKEKTATEILNIDEIEKIKALLEMDDDIDLEEDETHLSSDEYEARKVKAIKEQLIADGLEIVEEDEIVEELGIAAANFSEESDTTLDHKNKKEIQFSEDELSRIHDAIEAALEKMKPKKIKKLLKGKKVEIKIKLGDDQ